MNLIETVTSQFAELKALISSKSSLGDELAKAKEELTAVAGTISRQEQEISGLKAEKADLEQKLKAQADANLEAGKAIAAKDAEIAALQAAAKGAGERAAEMLAAQSIPAGQVPATDGGDKKAGAMQTYAALMKAGKALEAGKYWAENRELFK